MVSTTARTTTRATTLIAAAIMVLVSTNVTAENESIGSHNSGIQRTIDYMKEQTIAKIQEADAKPIVDELPDLPTIDISSWVAALDEQSTSYSQQAAERELVVQQVLEQVMEAGTFNVKGHGVPHDLLEASHDESIRFFQLPEDIKTKYSVEDEQQDGVYKGYVGRRHNLTLPFLAGNGRSVRQLFAVEDADFDAPPSLKAPLDDYIAHMERLDGVVRNIVAALLERVHKIAQSLPQARLHASDDATNVLRVSSYVESDEQGLQFPAHTDTAALTIMRIQMHGMDQVRNGQWVRIPPNVGDDIRIHLGDMMHIWSNGFLPANIHRVNTEIHGGSLVFGYVRNGNRVIEPVTSRTEALFPAMSTAQYKAQAKC